ncbi:MAG TPA: glycosyltransferase [Acidimicrobiales bacterium]
MRHERVAEAVPVTARTVLQIGQGAGWLATTLKQRHPAPVVYGVGTAGAAGPVPSDGLDRYDELDLDRDVLPLEPGSVDCIVYADVLLQVDDPLATLQRHRGLLSASGTIVCSAPNIQHHGVVSGLLRGMFPYIPGTPLDPSYRRLVTSASIMQLLLDARYAPDTVGRIEDVGGAPVAVAGAALFELLGVGAADAERDLGTATLIVRGTPLPDPEPADEVPLTFVACINDDAQLDANLRRSPCLQDDSPHELLVFRGCASAAEGLNAGIEQARHELVVLVHQDVYLPEGWPQRMVAQWRLAQRQGGPIGIGGVFGVLDRTVAFDAIGRVVHRDRLLSHRALPADVDGLDELLMVVPRHTPLRVDSTLGWHLYGTDLALQAQQRDLRVVVFDAPCHHNSLTGRVPWHYRQSERVLARKWESLLPIHTNLSSVGSWLLDAGAERDDPVPPALPRTDTPEPPGAIADLVTRLRREQVALNGELEQARLQVASMQASPFWRARQRYVAIRDRVSRRR